MTPANLINFHLARWHKSLVLLQKPPQKNTQSPIAHRPSAIHVIETFLDQRNNKGVARKKEKVTSAAIIWHVSTN